MSISTSGLAEVGALFAHAQSRFPSGGHHLGSGYVRAGRFQPYSYGDRGQPRRKERRMPSSLVDGCETFGAVV
jgi:hypothetical protein